MGTWSILWFVRKIQKMHKMGLIMHTKIITIKSTLYFTLSVFHPLFFSLPLSLSVTVAICLFLCLAISLTLSLSLSLSIYLYLDLDLDLSLLYVIFYKYNINATNNFLFFSDCEIWFYGLRMGEKIFLVKFWSNSLTKRMYLRNSLSSFSEGILFRYIKIYK